MPRTPAVSLAAALLLTASCASRRPENQLPGKFPEEIVFARSSDDVVNAGVWFTPPKQSAKPLAVIWVHGWGTNFYSPTYVGIGRRLAALAFTAISVNTRMHDIGNVEKHGSDGKRVRGGGYWGVTGHDARDISAWVDLAARAGFERVVLVGHSAGWASVGRYQVESADPRVAGLVLASGMTVAAQPNDPELVARARKLVAAGNGEDIMRLPNRSFPFFISAATYLDMEEPPPEFKDFFGVGQSKTPAVVRLKIPILAFFGTRGDVGGEQELQDLRAAVQRLGSAAPKVTTAMIDGGDHMYLGEEAQVAEKIARWATAELLK